MDQSGGTIHRLALLVMALPAKKAVRFVSVIIVKALSLCPSLQLLSPASLLSTIWRLLMQQLHLTFTMAESLLIFCQALDADKNGSITVEELREGMARQGSKVSQVEIQQLLAQMDADQSGTIDCTSRAPPAPPSISVARMPPSCSCT